MESDSMILGLEIGYNILINLSGTNIKACFVEDKLTFNDIKEGILSKNIQVKEFRTDSNANDTVKEISEWIFSFGKLTIKNIFISMFGPLNLAQGSEDYGTVINTPKAGWNNFNIVKALSEKLNVERKNIFVETDVNCAAYLEHVFGDHKVSSLAYITIGTGVGVGVVVNHCLIHGLQHPEGGHIRISKDPKDTFEGSCPIHKDCLEGMITNGAIKLRKKLNSVFECESISDDDEIWDFIANYIAQLCINLLYLVSLEKIIIGGGIINRHILLDKIHKKFIEINNNYIDQAILKKETIDNYIKRTDFKNDSGILSAFSLRNLTKA